MALTMKNKAARIQAAKLPSDLKKEYDMIRDETDGFTDSEICDIFQENFDTLYGMIENKAPGALKKGGQIKRAPAKKAGKPTKEAAVKKSYTDPWGFQKGDTVFVIDQGSNYFNKNYRAWRILDVKESTVEIENLDTGKVINVSDKSISVNLPPHALRPTMKDVKVDECKKLLREADYDISKKLEKGKRKTIRKKRPDKTIIKEKVADTITTIDKDIKADDPRGDELKKLTAELSRKLNLLIQRIDKIVNSDKDAGKLRKIINLLSDIIPD